jgi:hypothetical protein
MTLGEMESGMTTKDFVTHIKSTNGYLILIDVSDFKKASQFKWYVMELKRGFTIVRTIRKTFPNGKKEKMVLLSRFLTSAPGGMVVDHINGNTLDNTQNNLRVCKNCENLWNAFKPKGASKYKGVCFNKQTNQWQAEIQVHKKRIWLGRHNSEEEAARAYDDAAIIYHNQYARLNRDVFASLMEGTK